jgi:hypothetical protein
MMADLHKDRCPPKIPMRMFKIFIKKRRGQPITKRPLAVPAYEMWLADPQKSWMQVTRELCNCRKQAHDYTCKEQLKQQVNDLKNLLRRYQISVPHS